MPRPKKELQITETCSDFDKVKFGERFGNLLKERGYTIESFSAISGMSDSMIKAIKRGTRAPGMDNYVKIIEILNVNEMELLRDSVAFSLESETKRIILFFKKAFLQTVNSHLRTHCVVHEIHRSHQFGRGLLVDIFARFSRIVMPVTINIA